MTVRLEEHHPIPGDSLQWHLVVGNVKLCCIRLFAREREWCGRKTGRHVAVQLEDILCETYSRSRWSISETVALLERLGVTTEPFVQAARDLGWPEEMIERS